MQKAVSPCGLICTECEAYKATQADDADAIAAVAAEWSQRYGIAFSPDDLWCNGCATANGRRARATYECPIGPCARRRGLATCAECADYCCQNQARVHRLAPHAHDHRAAIRRRSR
jgi:hypothetical protein